MGKIIDPNHIRREGIKPGFFILAAVMFSFVIFFLDGIIDFIFFSPDRPFIKVIFPPIGSHEFFIRIMIIVTYLLFGIFVNNFLVKEFKFLSQLNESETKFKTVVNYTKDMEYWISPERNILFMSPSCEKITGYKADDFLKNPHLLNAIVFDDDKEFFHSHEEHALRGEDLDIIQFRIRRKDGSVIWVEHSCQSVFNSEGKYIGHRVSNRDITKRKLAEEESKRLSEKLKIANIELEKKVELRTKEIHQLFNQAPFAKLLLSPDYKILDVNPTFLKLFGTTKSYIINKNLRDCAFLDNPDALRCVEECKTNNTKITSHSIYFEQIDKMLIIDAYTIMGNDGKISQIVLNFEDVTDKLKGIEADHELNVHLKHLEKLLEYLELEKLRISRELHDQIGQKLLLAKMHIELLSEQYPENNMHFRKIMDMLAETNKEIRNIIYALYPAELENYGLLAAIELLINNFELLGNMKFSLEYSNEYKPMPPNVELNIYRIFQELFNNIVKHSKAKNISVKLTFDDDRFFAEVIDDGIGIKKGEAKIKGYGMVTMYERVRVLEGEMEIISNETKGTKVYLEIPIKENKIA